VAGQYYHVYNRGHNRQAIFFERENYSFFLRRVREYLVGESSASAAVSAETRLPKLRTLRLRSGQACGSLEALEVHAVVVAYCLMPNHFHLLVQPLDDQLSRRMQRLSISYTKAINKRHGRSGALYQGQFQAAHVDRDEYLLYLSRYIHLNPVEAGLVRRPEDWEFSSYREYVGLRQGTLPTPQVVLSQFSSPSAYREFVEACRPGDSKLVAHLLLDGD
jgi:REP element-mobilizing transposase RayT